MLTRIYLVDPSKYNVTMLTPENLSEIIPLNNSGLRVLYYYPANPYLLFLIFILLLLSFSPQYLIIV